jgi:hypothetical protein
MTTATKTCFKCLACKPITDFYVHPAMGDGRLNKCKVCARKDVQENYKANADYYRAYDRERGYRPGPPEKVKARMATRTLKRMPCEVCGAQKVEAHHDDYSKPLDVRWLCKKHHAEHHTRQEQAA